MRAGARSRAASTGWSPNREGSAMRCVSCGFARTALIAVFVAGAWTTMIPTAEGAAEIASSLASGPAPEGLRTVWHEGTDDPAATLDRLERAGFRVEITLPPHLFYVRESSR